MASLGPADTAGDRAWPFLDSSWALETQCCGCACRVAQNGNSIPLKNLSSQDEQNKDYLLSVTVLFFSHASLPFRLACTLKSHAAPRFP